MFIIPQKIKNRNPLYQNCGLCLAEMERFSRHAPHGIAPPKHSRLAPAVAILLVLSLAFARFIRHRRRSQRSLSRALAFKSLLCKKTEPPEWGVLFLAEMERLSRHVSHGFTLPKHSPLVLLVAILLVLTFAFKFVYIKCFSIQLHALRQRRLRDKLRLLRHSCR